ncbi:MAG: hypothetical protein NTW21_03015 [Verrucomicrobia bacterium]|nr:hypothetical protein [Verrucomicrobiota bacterium]
MNPTPSKSIRGAALFSGTAGVILGNSINNTAVATWSLADTASATIGTLAFGQASQAAGCRYLLFSGAATFNATTLSFNNTGTTSGNMNTISFATGSTATFTAGDKVLADYQVLVTAGKIRVDGVAQSDFSKFQVTETHTLSLVAGGPSADYTAWIAHYPGFTDTDPAHDPDHDGLSNFQEFAFGLDPTKGSSVNPITVPLDATAGTFSYTRRNPNLTALNYTVLISKDLQNWVANGPGGSQPPDSESAEIQTVAVQVDATPLDPLNGKLFERVQAE